MSGNFGGFGHHGGRAVWALLLCRCWGCHGARRADTGGQTWWFFMLSVVQVWSYIAWWPSLFMATLDAELAESSGKERRETTWWSKDTENTSALAMIRRE